MKVKIYLSDDYLTKWSLLNLLKINDFIFVFYLYY